MPESVGLAVVGGGLAGLTTALRAAELGLDVALFEQGADERYPCNSRFSGGVLHAAHRDVNRPAEEIIAAIDAAAFGQAAPDLAQAVAESGRELLAWLRANGARFMRFGPQEALRWGMAPPRPVAAGLDWRGRGPDATLRALADRFRQRGGRLVLAARAIELTRRGAQVDGLVIERAGRRIAVKAGAVVLADGGYQANPALLRAHVSPRPELLLQRGAATGRGDGLTMALAAGADVSRLNRFYGHLHAAQALTDQRLWPYPELDAVAAAGVVIDATGRRFTDEGAGGIAIANAIAALEEPDTAIAIFNEEIWQGPGRSARIPANPYFERFGGTVTRADSIGQLAVRLGIPTLALEETLEAHNRACESGRLAELSPPRSTLKVKPWPIGGGPYCAIPLCVGITYTMGGIVIDANARVLRPDSTPIEGLYAAGAATTGLEGGGNQGVGYVGGLIKAVFGLKAAEHAARRAQDAHRAAHDQPVPASEMR